jgi:DNA-binding IclR family transcriptional regulator
MEPIEEPCDALNHMTLLPEMAAPMYGVISHYYLGSKYPSGVTYVLQALAAIEATAPIAEDGISFFATLGDIVQHTGLEITTVSRILRTLEAEDVVVRKGQPFKKSTFRITWENTLLGADGADYMRAAQNAVYDY